MERYDIKKGIILFTTVICIALSSKSTDVYAAGNNYCDCSGGMSQYGEHLGNWTEKHDVYTGYKVDGKPIMNECTVYCSADRIAYKCTCCGHTTMEDKITEKHTGKYCPYAK